jgi:nucleotide-binding universal stress UspA family protein
MNEIIVGFDGREQGRDALRLGQWLARATQSRLGVAYVEEINPLFQETVAGIESQDSLYAEIFDQAAEALGSDAFERHILIGSVPRALELIAEATEASMLIVGSSHQAGLGKVLPGSVGTRLLAAAPCAIGVAPMGYSRQEPARSGVVGVGYDGEPEAKEALEFGTMLAPALQDSLRLIAVGPRVSQQEPGRISHTGPGYHRKVHEYLRSALDQAEHGIADLAHESQLREGEPAEILCKESPGLDLLVLGSRGYGPVRRVMLGGTAAEVLNEAQCPVLVVPRSSENGSRGAWRLVSEARENVWT